MQKNQLIPLVYSLNTVNFPNFGGKKSFSTNSGCHAQLHKGFWHHAKIQGNLMIHFYGNTQTDVRMEGWTDPIS